MRKLIIMVAVLLLFFATIFPKESKADLDLYSEAVILIDAKSGNVLFEKNSEQMMYPASITKIVTGIIAIEEGNLDDIVTISENARNQVGTRVYLLEGEKVPLLKLIQGLLINSGNDAGTAIAEYFNGSEKAFADRMTKFVKEKIGVHDTVFKNPHGLFDEEHVTTAKDMAKIAQYAMKNDQFREIVSTKEMDWVGEGWETTLYNHHRLLWDYEGTTGIKNGWVEQSGHTLVTSATRDGQELIVVTLNAPSAQNAYYDTMALLDYGFFNFSTEKIASAGDVLTSEDGEKYNVINDIWITTEEETMISYKVDDEGQFIVTNGKESDIILDSVELESSEQLTRGAISPIQEKENSKQTESNPTFSLVWIAIVLLSLFAAFLLLNFRLKEKRNKTKMDYSLRSLK
ncbi:MULTISPECIES: D-alanyl-D-alanine carboxypeptidase family protein [Sutcliffiella]|uniref:D-alanyl-D-alanine carboxypeptidase n=1 Tax=Sutcliffiella cohnii TaxID=33932 RepID=A0A223KPW3_9BACI|nr:MULTISPECIES: D-alanyl-D-alanine carboxypeptidase family protein [Sutcliffiella]AST91565.1 D-alanyl-D-alanine carboxypeptidase [Sutcliffiella cohnii]MED4014862.1 D-alanyl-D-alanine carboxypeptidase [Sutcliffiella cohnii]WBL17396.1 D-alanyl-D-alanine carboxypeptidase [Sutcliffiella sp. NC1]